MQPIIHFDPSKTSASTADKAATRLLFATAAESCQPTRHLDIKSAFTTETFQHDLPVFVRQLPALNGDYLHPEKRVGKLLLNLYGTKNACFIYLQGLDSHLSSNCYCPCEADPCFYFKDVSQVRILTAATVDYFLLTASDHLIDEF